MLARLEDERGVRSVEVDRSGTLLRVQLTRDGALAHVQAALFALGFGGEVLTDTPAELSWYGPSEVGELSKEEAQIIARRVAPPLAQAYDADPAMLLRLVAHALYECFVVNRSRDVSADAMRRACAVAVEDAARSVLGDDRAAELGRAVESDLEGGAT